ncbi:MAG: mechanosensitive ion channel family protein [Candidatus Promineifilaceae bacterium]
MPNLQDINFETIGLWLVSSGLQILLIIVLAFVAARFLAAATRYLSARIKRLDNVDGSELDKRTATIFNVLNNAGLIIILITATLMILNELTIDITPVLASVGIAGLAFGLGAQTLVKDVIGGIFILVEGQYQVGDVVELQGKVGTVEDLTLRITSVRDFQGDLHIIPNGDIRLVTNKGRSWSRAIVDVAITYETDIEQTITTLEEIGRRASEDAEIGRVLLEAPTVTGVEALENGQIRLRLIVKTVANEQWGVQRFLRRRIQETFNQKGIKLALPRQEIRLSENPNQSSS